MSNFVKATQRFKPREPNNHGKGSPMTVPIYPPIIPILELYSLHPYLYKNFEMIKYLTFT